MNELRFYGGSDDLVEVEGVIRDEFNGDDITFEVTRDDGQGEIEGCRVRVRYTDGGVWAVEVSQIDEDFPIPWPARIDTQHSYSAALVIEVPGDVRLEQVE